MTGAPQNGIKGLAKRRGLEFLPAATNILNKEDFVYLRRGGDFARGYRLFGRERHNPALYISHELIDFLVRHYGFYLEVPNGVILAFRPDQELANAEHIALLFVLAEIFNASCLASGEWQASAGTLSPVVEN